MLGILPFLVQWIALSQLGSQISHLRLPDKSYWSLLSDFKNLSENEVEKFLPQVCNILIDKDNTQDPDVFSYLEKILAEKCAGCLTFGLRTCSLLKAASQGLAEGILWNVLPGNSVAQQREERIRYLTDLMESATAQGVHLPARVEYMRGVYYRDVGFVLDSLARLGIELKSYPVTQRNSNLRNAIAQLNSLLFNRMLSKGQFGLQQLSSHLGSMGAQGFPSQSIPSTDTRASLTLQEIVRNCPDVADHALHIPLQHCDEKVQRILRFVENECEVLPSKDRCPFLLVCEVIERPYLCKSDRLYATAQSAQSTQQLIEHAMGQRTLGPPLQQVSVSVEESIEIPAASAEIAPPSFIPIQPTTPSFLQSNFDDPIEKNENVELFARDSVSVSANSESSASKTSTEESTDSESIASVESSASQPTGENNTKPTIDAPNTRKVFQSRRNRRPAPLEFRGGSSSGGEMNPTFDYLTAAASPQHSTQSSEQPVQAFGWENSFDSSHSPQYRAEVLSQQSSSVDVSNNADTYTGVMGSSPSPSSGLPSGMSFNNAAVARSANFFVRSKTAEEKRELVRATSEFGHLPGWTLKSFIVKSGDDLRKEMLAMQLIEYVQKVFTVEGLDILLRPYQIICTGSQTGLIEFLEDTKSIDRIKKSFRSDPSDGSAPLVPALKDYFEFCFGPSYTFVHSQAVNNFVRSLVGYSLITYVLQVKDRHNANILVDNSGSLIHIDFGFILGESPGMNINFENAPFKLTREYIDVLGGVDSAAFKQFEELFIKGFLAIQKHVDGMFAIVQAYFGTRRKGVADALRSRVLFANSHADIVGLIRDSLDSWRTKQYDWYQQKANNIVM